MGKQPTQNWRSGHLNKDNDNDNMDMKNIFDL